MNGGFSTIYMSRNRVRCWCEPSLQYKQVVACSNTPASPKMEKVELNKQIFVPGKEHLYRRLSVRECARIQTFLMILSLNIMM